MLFKDDKPPTSKDEAHARRVRPPPEKYDPDTLSHWPITTMVAWIIWGEIDAVRNEWDDYRNGCADWVFENDPIARAQIGQIGPQKGSWHLHQWPPSGWNRLYLRAISENILEPRQQAIQPPQAAIDELWLVAGEGRIKATALECKNAKALDGDRIEIPAHYWPRLKRTDDPLTGKAILYDDQGRVYREVLFSRLEVKELWPKSAENAQIVPARKGSPPIYDWEDAMNFAEGEFKRRGDYNDLQNAEDGWRSQADLARLVADYMAKHNGGNVPSDSMVKSHLKNLLERIRQ
jgi:hypothetical protein